MEPLDTADGFDLHDHRDKLKLVTQSDDTAHLENRGGYACPACGEAFEKLFVAEGREVTFQNSPNGPLCLVRTDDQLLVVAH
jgi:hypothetical protein